MRFGCINFRHLLAVILTFVVALQPSVGSTDASLSHVNRMQEVLDAYGSNAVPDLSDPVQSKLFEIYIKRTFQGRVDLATPGRLKKLSEMSDKMDLAGKSLFGSVDVQMTARSFPVSSELRRFASDLVKAAGTLSSLFLQPAANTGSWMKLKYQGQPLFADRAKLDAFILAVSPSLESPLPEYMMRVFRAELHKLNIQPHAVKRIMEGLIHLQSLNHDGVRSRLRSDRGEEVLAALNDYLVLRREWQRRFGDMSAPNPNDPVIKVNILSNDQFQKEISRFEAQIFSGASEEVRDSFRVRPLSQIESPFRSCLASSDCSTNTYFDRALDPAFYYFTVTEADKKSKGQVTIALGDAETGSSSGPIALVDKIQDIDLDRLELVLEAIRQSVAREGYLLALPEVLIDSQLGLSNYPEIRLKVKNLHAYSGQSQVFTDYRSRGSKENFEAGYSQAFKTSSVKPLLPLDLERARTPERRQADFRFNSPQPHRKVPNLISLANLENEIQRLKDGNDEDRILYLELIDQLFPTEAEQTALKKDLVLWAQDQKLSRKLRAKVLRIAVTVVPIILSDLWPYYEAKEIQSQLFAWKQEQPGEIRISHFQFAILSALPYLNLRDELLGDLIKRRHDGLGSSAISRLVQMIRTPEVQVAIHQIATVPELGKARRAFVALLYAAIFSRAQQKAELDKATEVVNELKELSHDLIKNALYDLKRVDGSVFHGVKEKIGSLWLDQDELNRVEPLFAMIKPKSAFGAMCEALLSR